MSLWRLFPQLTLSLNASDILYVGVLFCLLLSGPIKCGHVMGSYSMTGRKINGCVVMVQVVCACMRVAICQGSISRVGHACIAREMPALCYHFIDLNKCNQLNLSWHLSHV